MLRLVLGIGTTLALVSTALFGARQPVPVAPGSLAGAPVTTTACPTFHWAQAENAGGYELAVHKVEAREVTKIEDDPSGALALREVLPPGVGSWTPSLDRCLEAGGRYAWTVRAVSEKRFGATAFGDWSEARHFVVREEGRLERVLGRVLQRMIEEGELLEEDVEQLAAWGLDGPGSGSTNTGSAGTERPAPKRVALEAAEPRLDALEAQSRLLSQGESAFTAASAAFQVDGAGYERGIYAEGDTYGAYGVSSSATGRGVFGWATATSGAPRGVYGRSDAPEGQGVLGYAPATSGINYGVWGQSESPTGRGVYGVNSAVTGFAYGLFGQSNSTGGRGVFGIANATSGDARGVFGRSDSTEGIGVLGAGAATTGNNVGVWGQSSSTAGTGVFGYVGTATGLTTGVWGQSESTSGSGVYGDATAATGFTNGVYGRSESTSGAGVFGYATATSGTTWGVYGRSDSASGFGFYAESAGTDYGPFTGGHEARLARGEGEVVPGMVVSVTGRAERREENGVVTLSSTLPTVALSRRANDPSVFGVLVAASKLHEDHWYLASDGERFATVNALGEGRVWVTDANGSIQAGDYLTTSDIAGYAQRQGDGVLRNYTLGKAIETIDWDAVTETVEHGGEAHKRALLAVVYTSG